MTHSNDFISAHEAAWWAVEEWEKEFPHSASFHDDARAALLTEIERAILTFAQRCTRSARPPSSDAAVSLRSIGYDILRKHQGTPVNGYVLDDIEAALAAARTAGFAEAREKAVKVAEDFHWILPLYTKEADPNETSDDAAESVKEQIATALRAIEEGK